MRRRELLKAAGLAPLAPARTALAAGEELAPLAKGFIDMMVERHGFGRAELEAAFAGMRANGKVLDLIKPPEEGGRKFYWDEYRAIHVTINKIGNGVLFAGTHEDDLARAEREYGVPGEIITAIIGIETRYGGYTGNYDSLEAIATLAFAYPPRAEYFAGELEQLFLHAREQGTEPGGTLGSYAGATGYPQFMPTSLRTWAVDFDGDGKVDLFTFSDSIGSVANFLVDHGWERGFPVAFPVEPGEGADPQRLLGAGIVPALTAEDFAAAGMPVDFGGGAPFRGNLALIDLENEDGYEYRAGTINYYVLTRYNRSNKYAMAVLDLASEIRERA